MKFNTAGLFLLLSLGVLNMLYTRNEYSVFDKIVSFSLIFIGSITLLEYTLAPNFTIDKLFIEDEITDTFPGRMSGATAFCFVFLGFALNGIYSKKAFITKLTQYVLLVVLLISLISIEAFILQIPSVKRIFFLNSMALHTSLLFIFTSIALALQNPTAGFMGLLTGHLLGSRIIVKSLFILVLTPLILSFCWLIVTNEGWMEKDFGIAVYTVLLLLIFLVFIGNLATKLNHLDLERNVLENALLDANQELT
ncbi:MAG: hypothetical protein WA951_04830, partial [Leeuwenhoekiella sp.]